MNIKEELDIAEDLRLSGDYTAAKVKYEAILVEDNEQLPEYAHSLRGLAEIYRMLENETESKAFYSKAIHKYQELNHSIGLGYTYLGIGQLNRHQNNTAEAKENIQESIKCFNESSDSLPNKWK